MIRPASGTKPAAYAGALADALGQLRDQLSSASFPLELPTAPVARRRAEATIEQLDDYLLPRLARLDAPLLVVVGGSTGAGKSTLVNSLVREAVTTTGILRPTTRSPVLVCHPADVEWFSQARLLPNLPRLREGAGQTSNGLQIVASPSLTQGLALLDAPDIDSVVETNRNLAEQLLAAADLWLFVTSAARYADAVPWDVLHSARDRGTSVALVLDRVPAGGGPTVTGHLRQMLHERGLGDAPIFVVGEQSTVVGQVLDARAVRDVQDWLRLLAGDAARRSAVVRSTVDGAIAALDPAVDGLAMAAEEQARALSTLEGAIDTAYRTAHDDVARAIADGSLLRGEVLARWQQLVGTGEFMRGLQARVARARDRLAAAVTGRPSARDHVREALESGLVTLIRGAAADAAERTGTDWLAHPAGAALLRGRPTLSHAEGSAADRAHRLVRDWQREVLELVRDEVGDRALVARLGAYAVNFAGLVVMIAVFSATAFIPTGAEVAVAGGTTVAAQKLLEAIFGDQAVRALAERARVLLLDHVRAFLDEDASRFRSVLAALGIDPQVPDRLRQAVARVRAARPELGGASGTAASATGGRP